jgi:hypothetical protein
MDSRTSRSTRTTTERATAKVQVIGVGGAAPGRGRADGGERQGASDELHLKFDAVAVAYRKAMRTLGLAG